MKKNNNKKKHCQRLSDLRSTEIIARVTAHEDPPFRPVVEANACKEELQSLMTQCWDDDPDKRPHFNKILDRLRKVMGRYV